MRTFYAFLSCSILTCFALTTAPTAQAQEVIYDSVVLGEGNANMSFYSLANGELAQVPLADWHIALDVRPMGATARINCGLGLKLFHYGSLAEWDNVDLSTWLPADPYRNEQMDWSYGAFSQGGDGMFDLGWGVYDVVTHVVTSDVMYLVQLPDESWKKVALLSLSSGVYDLQFANLDGTDFFNVSVNKADYDGQLFAYCNLLTGTVEDLEPAEPWDIAFFTYEDEVAPGTYYPVTGGLIHPNVTVQQSEGLADPFLDGSYSFDSFSFETNAIGHDWKSFVPGQGYAIEAERCYFVADSYGDVWRMVFTGFGGSATGEITFGLLEAGTIANGVAEAPVEAVRFYPNPLVSGQPLTVATERAARIRVFAANGSQIIDEQVIGMVQLNLPELTSGLYIVEMTEANGTRHTQQLIVR
jgi:hypothetical protein